MRWGWLLGWCFVSALTLACGGGGTDGPAASGGNSSGGADNGSGGATSGGTSSGGSSGGGDSLGGSASGGSDLGGSGGFVECAPANVIGQNLEETAEFYDVVEGPLNRLIAVHAEGDDVYALQEGALFVIHGDELEVTLVSDQVTGLGRGGDGRLRTTASHFYFPLAHGIGRLPKAGGTVEVLYEDPAGERQIDYLEVAGDTVYFSILSEEGVFSVPVSGGEPTQVSETIQSTGFARLGDAVYVADFASGAVQTLAPGGPWTPASPVGIFYRPRSVAVSTEQVFWVDDNTLKAAPHGSPDAVTELGEAGAGTGLQFLGDRVYWRSYSIGWIAADGSACGMVVEGNLFSEVHGYAATEDYVFVAVGTDLELIRIAVE